MAHGAMRAKSTSSVSSGHKFAGAVVVLMGAVIAASYLPLRRALRVNPVDVLRSE
jgi:ABC-type lipoprotein release transport system permease subunit